MRRVVPLSALIGLLVLAAGLPGADASTPTGFAFGRVGGNIRPFHVTVANSGAVRTFGPVTVGRTRITAVQLVALNRVATETSFTTLQATTNCRGSLPDVATTYIRVGARTVRVHGGCVPRFQRLLKSLETSVRLMSG
jgi:hypothetical protein